MVNEQQKLILQLDKIKGKIQETDDREKIAHYIQQAIKLTVPVEPIEKITLMETELLLCMTSMQDFG